MTFRNTDLTLVTNSSNFNSEEFKAARDQLLSVIVDATTTNDNKLQVSISVTAIQNILASLTTEFFDWQNENQKYFSLELALSFEKFLNFAILHYPTLSRENIGAALFKLGTYFLYTEYHQNSKIKALECLLSALEYLSPNNTLHDWALLYQAYVYQQLHLEILNSEIPIYKVLVNSLRLKKYTSAALSKISPNHYQSLIQEAIKFCYNKALFLCEAVIVNYIQFDDAKKLSIDDQLNQNSQSEMHQFAFVKFVQAELFYQNTQQKVARIQQENPNNNNLEVEKLERIFTSFKTILASYQITMGCYEKLGFQTTSVRERFEAIHKEYNSLLKKFGYEEQNGEFRKAEKKPTTSARRAHEFLPKPSTRTPHSNVKRLTF